MRILTVDDHPLFREAVVRLLENVCPGASIFEAGSMAEAKGILNLYDHFDLILLDISLPDVTGISGIHETRKLAGDALLVILSELDDPLLAKAAIGEGAKGFITKSAGGRDIRNALHLILAGEIYISPSMLVSKTVRQDAPTDIEVVEAAPLNVVLTARQQEVFGLMVQGLSNKSIARSLNCSEGTVKLHVSAILRILHARNRTEAVQVSSRLALT